MKRILKHISLLFLAIGFYSCNENTFTVDTNFKTGIYFSEDSIKYSFGVTPLTVQEHTVNVPVKIMGSPSNQNRLFKIEIIDVGEAVEGKHFQIQESISVLADSINAVVPIKILRQELGTSDFRLRFRLVENDHFVPVNEKYKNAVLYFNNNVDRPNWRDWRGQLVWPSSQLGAAKAGLGWNPVVYIKFIELFRQMKDLAPDKYNAIVAVHGEDLAVINQSWPYDFNQSLTKYVLIPLYQYYMEQNPQLGEVIPRPSGY